MTVTTTTSTAIAQLSSLDCSSCKVNNIPAATHAAANRPDGLEVRRLNEPSNPQYGGNVEAFLLTEYIWAEWVPFRGIGIKGASFGC